MQKIVVGVRVGAVWGGSCIIYDVKPTNDSVPPSLHPIRPSNTRFTPDSH